MIHWFTGNTGAGKTTLANKMKDARTIILDGDNCRYIWQDLDLSKEGRWEQSIRVARLAKELSDQGFNVNVAVICPYEKLRQEVKAICKCIFVYVPYGVIPDEEHPYEIPEEPDIMYCRKPKDQCEFGVPVADEQTADDIAYGKELMEKQDAS